MAPKPLDVTTRMFETAFASPTSRFELCVDTLGDRVIGDIASTSTLRSAEAVSASTN